MKLSNLPVDARIASNFARTILSRAGLDPSYRKVFAIGFNKTGTSSIHSVFQRSGLYAVHSAHWNLGANWLDLFIHQAFSDGIHLNFAELDGRFPHSRFILNIRNLDEWIDSRLEHIRHMIRAGRHTDTGHWSYSVEAVAAWTIQRSRHHLAVLDHFANRPDDLLVVNYIRDPNAAARISAFAANRFLADKPHQQPIKNTREQGVLRNRDMIAQAMESLGLPDSEWNSDIWNPGLAGMANIGNWPADSENLRNHPFMAKD